MQKLRTKKNILSLIHPKFPKKSQEIFLKEVFFNIQHNKSKPFLLNYKTTVSPSIAVLNKSIIEPGFNIGVKSAESKKKKRGGVLKDNIGNRKFATAKMSSGCFWKSETGNTTESDSVDMEKECLVEETSFDYREGNILADRDSDHCYQRFLEVVEPPVTEFIFKLFPII
ncbi:hypothetical protein G9A89_022715 [Geosiphon pyriformis]|nr:hypothetical protein G9A89_022715 [Geosiphon pyriformis]